MVLQIQTQPGKIDGRFKELPNFKDRTFSKDYVDFLNDAGWRLEKKLPSNSNYYSDLLEDTDWTSFNSDNKRSRHYRRDLDAI
tara:strand:+ start:423 stop:671 length:249 start_codon:yes stop_codon:yes gene_type:complete